MSYSENVHEWMKSGAIKRCVLESDNAVRVELGSVGHFHFYREFAPADGIKIETLNTRRHSVRFSFDSWEAIGPESQAIFAAFKHHATPAP